MAEHIPQYHIPILFSRVIGDKRYSYSAFGTLVDVSTVVAIEEVKKVDSQDLRLLPSHRPEPTLSR